MKRQIDDKINEITSKYNYIDDGCVDIIKLAEKNNILIGNSYLPHGEDGYLVTREDGNAVIGLNMQSPSLTKRYIAAYIMGLYYFKEHSKDVVLEKIKLTPENLDLEIDYFARALLLPQASFIENYNRFKNEMISEEHIDEELSEQYQVPVQMIGLRKKEIDVIVSKNNEVAKKLIK